MSVQHYAYGLRIGSNLPIPGLIVQDGKGVDLRVWLATPSATSPNLTDESAELWYTSPYEDDDGNPTLEAWKLADRNLYKLRYSDGIEFVVDSLGENVWGSWPSGMTVEDTAVYLLGPVLGFVLRLRGNICLHASAIGVEKGSIALIGPAGSGKSTTAAAFAKLGHSILADDVATLTGDADSCFVQPAYPHLRLWPKSVNILYGDPSVLPKLVPNSAWEKCYLSLTGNGNRFQHDALPLQAAYILDERADSPNAPFVEEISVANAVMALVTNAYATHLLDRSMRAKEFAFFSRMVTRIPVKRVVPHSDPELLPDLCRAILRDFSREVC